MVSLIGYKMIQENKHLPGEIYKEIMSYLIPKYLLNIPEINNYNKVVAEIPGFESTCECEHGCGGCPEKFGYVTTIDYTIRYIYHLKHNYKYTTQSSEKTRFIWVYLPFLPNENHEQQYVDYLQSNHIEKRGERDLHKAIYG